jgi:hypothetical protein
VENLRGLRPIHIYSVNHTKQPTHIPPPLFHSLSLLLLVGYSSRWLCTVEIHPLGHRMQDMQRIASPMNL